MTKNRAKDWLSQSDNDLLFAKAALRAAFSREQAREAIRLATLFVDLAGRTVK
jgi:hypothetical protein